MTPRPPLSKLRIPLRCQSCRFVWTFVLVLPVAIKHAIPTLFGETLAGCPRCRESAIEIARRGSRR